MSAPSTRTLRDRCAGIELLVLDVDGVLTEGGISFDSSNAESKTFHVRDGSALAQWHRVGKKAAIITGRTSSVVTRRAKELNIEFVHQGVHEKKTVLDEMLAAQGFDAASVCYIGDDLADLPSMNICGLVVAPSDAACEVRATAHFLARHGGGRGAVRETIELILRCQGHWPTH